MNQTEAVRRTLYGWIAASFKLKRAETSQPRGDGHASFLTQELMDEHAVAETARLAMELTETRKRELTK